MATVAVIGGGISGLSAAYYLSRAQLPNLSNIVVLEAGNRLGGWVHSRRCDDGAVFEFGPRTLRPYGKSGLNTLQLVEDLGLQHRLIHVPKTHPAAKRRFVYANGGLHALPGGAKSLMSPFPSKPFTESLAKIIIRESLRKYPWVEDESVHDFIGKHFGQDLANYVMNPLCRGIYAGDSRLLSAKSCFAVPFQLASNHGSLVRGIVKGAGARLQRRLKKIELEEEKLTPEEQRWKETVKDTSVWTLKAGLQDLTDALVEKLEEDPRVEIRLNARVASLSSSPSSSPSTAPSTSDDKLRLVTTCYNSVQSASILDADHVISSIYAKDLADALTATPLFPETTTTRDGWRREEVDVLTSSLRSIPAVTVCVVNLEYLGDVLPFPGFGYLVPSFESEPLLGCVFDSAALPHHNAQTGTKTTRLTVMMGGAWFERHFGNPDSPFMALSSFEEMAISAATDHLNIQVQPCRTHVTVQKNCIPQYLVGHDRLLSQIDSSLDASQLPLSLIGSSYRGVSVNDCAFNAKKKVDRVVEKLKNLPPVRSQVVKTLSRDAQLASASN